MRAGTCGVPASDVGPYHTHRRWPASLKGGLSSVTAQLAGNVPSMSSQTPLPESSLAGHHALVTGATRGIGRAIAEALARAGSDLVITGRDEAGLEEVAQAIRGAWDVEVHPLTADLAEPGDLEALATRAWDAAGSIEVLVNNAGISHPQPVVETDSTLWDEVLAVNLRAPALLSAQLGRLMADAGRGSIVNVASTAGQRALAEHYSYSTSKAGLIMATKVLALELGPFGVRANVVCPTIVMTEMGQQVWGDPVKAAPMLGRIPTGRFAEPDEVADAVVYLASPAAAMINGIELAIDGGFGIS